MTQPRSHLGRTTLAAASLLVIATLTSIASPATAEPETVRPGPTPPDV
jgi:extracellular elastinolytic metalloproteinase